MTLTAGQLKELVRTQLNEMIVETRQRVQDLQDRLDLLRVLLESVGDDSLAQVSARFECEIRGNDNFFGDRVHGIINNDWQLDAALRDAINMFAMANPTSGSLTNYLHQTKSGVSVTVRFDDAFEFDIDEKYWLDDFNTMLQATPGNT